MPRILLGRLIVAVVAHEKGWLLLRANYQCWTKEHGSSVRTVPGNQGPCLRFRLMMNATTSAVSSFSRTKFGILACCF